MTSYLVEYLVVAPSANPCALRQWLAKTLPWSKDLLVVGDGELIKVHVRTSRPDVALRGGIECGPVEDVLVREEHGPRVAV